MDASTSASTCVSSWWVVTWATSGVASLAAILAKTSENASSQFAASPAPTGNAKPRPPPIARNFAMEDEWIGVVLTPDWRTDSVLLILGAPPTHANVRMRKTKS